MNKSRKRIPEVEVVIHADKLNKEVRALIVALFKAVDGKTKYRKKKGKK